MKKKQKLKNGIVHRKGEQQEEIEHEELKQEVFFLRREKMFLRNEKYSKTRFFGKNKS